MDTSTSAAHGRFAPPHPLPGPPAGADGELGDALFRYLVANAQLAPSGGNLQAWRFSRQGGGVLRCQVDAARSDYFTNYRLCESYVSLGAAVMNLELAARALGWRPELGVFTAGEPPELGCDVHLGRSSPDAGAAELAGQIPWRMTCRSKGARVPLPDGDRRLLESIAASHQARLLLLTRPEDLAAFGAILGKLNLVGYLNERSHAAIMQMLRWTDEEAAATRDGIPINTFELSPLEITGLRFVRSWEVMKFVSHMGAARAIESLPAAWSTSASAVALLTLPGDGPRAHFLAGRALEQMWLAATGRGWAFHVWGVSSYFDRLLHGQGEGFRESDRASLGEQRRRYVELFQIPPGSCETVLFRILPPNPLVGRTYRRGVDDVLR